MLRCAVCHDDLRRFSEPPCAGCRTLVHRECLAALRGCPTLGCPTLAAPPRVRPRAPWSSAGARVALGVLLLFVSPCLTGQLAVVRAGFVDADRLRADADHLLARPLDLTDPRWDDPLSGAELAGAPYLAQFRPVRRWGDDAVSGYVGGGIPAFVGVVVVARGADTRAYDGPQRSGFTRYRRLADRVYLCECYR